MQQRPRQRNQILHQRAILKAFNVDGIKRNARLFEFAGNRSDMTATTDQNRHALFVISGQCLLHQRSDLQRFLLWRVFDGGMHLRQSGVEDLVTWSDADWAGLRARR